MRVVIEAFESESSWMQPTPTMASEQRHRLIDATAATICEISDQRLRIGVDGMTAAGKTSFGHELAAAVRKLGRPTLRACFDDFKKPWRDAREKGYDRVTGDGYYRNAPDFESARKCLLEPAGQHGSGEVALCGHDPLTGEDKRNITVMAPTDSVLIVDSVFAFRPEYDDCWDFRIWLDIDASLSLSRGVERDTAMEGQAEAERLHRDRYQAAEHIYVDEVDPVRLADLVIDNTDFANPVVLESA